MLGTHPTGLEDKVKMSVSSIAFINNSAFNAIITVFKQIRAFNQFTQGASNLKASNQLAISNRCLTYPSKGCTVR